MSDRDSQGYFYSDRLRQMMRVIISKAKDQNRTRGQGRDCRPYCRSWQTKGLKVEIGENR